MSACGPTPAALLKEQADGLVRVMTLAVPARPPQPLSSQFAARCRAKRRHTRKRRTGRSWPATIRSCWEERTVNTGIVAPDCRTVWKRLSASGFRVWLAGVEGLEPPTPGFGDRAINISRYFRPVRAFSEIACFRCFVRAHHFTGVQTLSPS